MRIDVDAVRYEIERDEVLCCPGSPLLYPLAYCQRAQGGDRGVDGTASGTGRAGEPGGGLEHDA